MTLTEAERRPPAGGDLLSDAKAILPEIVRVRRHIHRHPEVGLDLPETQETVVEELRQLGLQPRLGKGLSSVTAVIGEGRPGRTVVLRGDMDALPLTEDTGLDFASEIEGRMHACGHDTHVAMLLGGARLLVERFARNPESLPGPVLLMFQPGEEGQAGAKHMLDEGLLDGLDPSSAKALAIHISTMFPSGQVHLRPGPIMASADSIKINVRGRGGHASAPHLSKDPIPVAAQIVGAIGTALTREVDVFDPAVVTIAHITAGTTHNIIPESAFMEGTFRTVSEERHRAIPAMIERVAKGIGAAYGIDVEFTLLDQYPVTINDAGVYEAVRILASDLLGEDDVVTMAAPIMGAEDWSFVLQKIPGVMAFLGGRPRSQDPATYPNNHSNKVVFEESAMAVGAALYAKAGLEL